MLHRLRVPRWALDIPALEPLLTRLHHLRQRYYTRPEEHAMHMALRGNTDDAVRAFDSLGAGKKDLGASLGAVQALISAQRWEEARDRARQVVADFPGDMSAWLQLGQAEYAIAQRSPAARSSAHGEAPPAQPLLQEDGELLDMLARPGLGPIHPSANETDAEAVSRLKALAKTVAAENAGLAMHLEPLRQQLGHRVEALETWIKYEHTKYYMRALALYMRRHGVVDKLPVAPAAIPDHLAQGFSMNGSAEIQQGYLNAAYPNSYQDIYTDFDIQVFQRVWRGEPAAGDDDRQCQIDFALALGPTDKAMKDFVTKRVGRGDTVAAIGSRGPVYEALCLGLGARPTTIRPGKVDNRAKDLETATYAEVEKAPRRFDAAIAVWTIEQAGLGMHGEALDPDGDLKLMAMLKRLVKPDGTLFLVVPTGPDCTVFNTTRVYGDARLKRLLDGWTTVDRHRHQEPLLHGRGEDRSLFVLSNAA
ncbi:MAG: DUF268 domain-containing protein [Alphaproteobacteria bacterium]|nr:DUF268 domain-containing protein [Alphaproteobacteria bacterium]